MDPVGIQELIIINDPFKFGSTSKEIFITGNKRQLK